MKKIVILTLALIAMSVVLFAQQNEKPMPGNDKEFPPYQMHKKMMGNQADNPPDMGPMMDKDNFKKMAKELDLSKEQIRKIEDLRTKHMQFMNTKRAEMENLQIDKRTAMRNEQFDKVKQINKQISDLQLLIENAQVDHQAAIFKELKPEQKEKLKDMLPMFGKGRAPGQNRWFAGRRGAGKANPCKGNCQ